MASQAAINPDKVARDAWIRALQLTAAIPQNPTVTLPIAIVQAAARFPDRPALIGEHNSLTYRELSDRADRYADWAIRQGVGFGGTPPTGTARSSGSCRRDEV